MESILSSNLTSTTSFRQHNRRNSVIPTANAAISGCSEDEYPPKPKSFRNGGGQRQAPHGKNINRSTNNRYRIIYF